MPINFNALNAADAGANFRQGVTQGQTTNALSRYAGGDTAGGINALMPIDPVLAGHLQDRNELQKTNAVAADETARQHGVQVMTHVLGSVRRTIADPAQRIAAINHSIDQLAPALGLQPEQVTQLHAMAQNIDPSNEGLDGLLRNLGGQPPHNTALNLGRYGVATVDENGTVTGIATPPEPPISPIDQARIAEINSRIPLHAAQAERASRPAAGNNGHRAARASGGGGRRARGGGGRDGGSGATPNW